MFDGDTAFTLYDTYGFPLDLTQDALRNRGYRSTSHRSTTRWRRQRAPAPAPWAGTGDTATRSGVVCIARSPRRHRISGLRHRERRGRGRGHWSRTARKSGRSKPARPAPSSLNQTPFYAESGGQVGDTGVMTGDGVRFRVTDTQKKAGDLFVHIGTVEQGTLKTGAALALRSITPAARRSAPPFRDASAARGAAPDAWRPHRAERFAGRAGTPALRLRASETGRAGGVGRIEDIANGWCWKTTRCRRG